MFQDEGEFENEQLDVISSIPVENVPVPADVKKLTVNKNSGETLLHRAARMGHEVRAGSGRLPLIRCGPPRLVPHITTSSPPHLVPHNPTSSPPHPHI